MKWAVPLLLLAATVLLRGADDFIQNGDFSSGLAHWFGDIKTLSEIGADPTATGVAIKLRGRQWSRVEQEFRLAPGTYKLHVVFSLTGVKFSGDYSDYVHMPTKLDFPDATPIDASVGQWMVVVADKDAQTSRTWTVDPTHPEGSQSYTFTIEGIDFDHRQALVLGFPPGTGLIRLEHISLMPDAAK